MSERGVSIASASFLQRSARTRRSGEKPNRGDSPRDLRSGERLSSPTRSQAEPLARGVTIATVLLVEDQADLREMLRTALGTWGYNVLAAEDGRRGLAILNNQAQKIDMLLLDVTLPFLSGLELAAVSKTKRPTTKCLMMSGHEQPSGICNDLPNCRFIQKPFRLHDLRAAITEMFTSDGNEI